MRKKAIEQIEEQQMRSLFSTVKGCPIHIMYLDGGLEPARFVIMKSMVMYLHYNLQQNYDCLLITMLKAPADSPSKDDWLSTLSTLSYLEINITFEEIKQLTKIQFHKMLTKQTRVKAFSYLS